MNLFSKNKNNLSISDHLNKISDDHYKICLSSLPIVTVDIVIFNAHLNKVLLLYRNNKPAQGIYFTPGSRLIKGEDIYSCARRVLNQELGIQNQEFKLNYVGFLNELFENSIFNDVSTHNLDFYYSTILDAKILTNIQLDNQHSHYKWFDINDINIHDYVKVKLKNSIKVLTHL